jgi:glycosyltransferase involved in cell wall biosynthesis
MRVCLVTSAPLPPREGLGYHVWNLARELIVRDNQVEIITRGSSAQPREQHLNGVMIKRAFFVPAYPFHVHLHGLVVERMLRCSSSRLDLVNAHSPLPPAVSGGLPLVTTVHSPMMCDTAATRRRDLGGLAIRLQTPISRRIEMNLLSRSRQITAVARWIPAALQSYGVDVQAISVTGNAVEAEFLDAPSGLHGAPYGLYVGRLEASKGLSDLVDAARVLAQHGACSDLTFVIVGEGPLAHDLADRVRGCGLTGRFRFAGHVGPVRRAELMQLYRDARFFVLPSHHEGLPTVLLEALSCGLPVIATACTGSTELIQDGETGLLVAPHDPPALAEAIRTLWMDPGLGARLGRQGRALVERGYTWDVVVSRYLTSYAAALNGGKVAR